MGSGRRNRGREEEAWSIGNGVTEFRDSCRFQTRHRAREPYRILCRTPWNASTFPTPRFSARGKEGNNSE